jgi:23S rRNA G2445 N2-methylase RlmL
MTKLIKSKERVRLHAEVFTPPELVNEMLDRLPQSQWEPDKTFLDPTCGNGAMVLEVVRRKIELGHCPMQALGTTYGIDIMEDNVEEAKQRLIDLTEDCDEAWLIVNKNIKCADSLLVDWEEIFK